MVTVEVDSQCRKLDCNKSTMEDAEKQRRNFLVYVAKNFDKDGLGLVMVLFRSIKIDVILEQW